MRYRLFTILPAAAALLFVLIAEPPRYSLPLLGAIAWHECGHLAALRLFCGRFGKIRPVPFGLSLALGNTLISYKKELLVCAAGPLANFLAAGVAVLLAHGLGRCQDWLFFFLVCNLLLGLVNLLPVKTLDGGRMVLCLLLMLTLPHRAERIAQGLSLCLICLLWTGAVYLWITVGQSPYLIFLSVYLFVLSLNKKEEKLKYFG